MKRLLLCVILSIFIFVFPNLIEKVKAAYVELEYKEIKMMTLTDGTQIEIPVLKDENYSQLVIDKRSEKEIYIMYYKNTVQYFKLTTNSVTEKNHYAYPGMDRYSIYYCTNTNTYNGLGCSSGYEAYENKWNGYNNNNNPVNYKEILYTDIEFRTNDEKTVVIERTVLKPTINYGQNDVGNSTYINIEFSIFDTSKFIYEYSLYDTNKWIEITNNYFLKQVTKDGTIFVRIRDRQTGEYVTSSSFYFDNVIKLVPSIDYNVEINDLEYVSHLRKLYNIKLLYKNMSDEYYSVYYNLKDGVKKYIGSGSALTEYKIENVNDDSIITAYIYDNENNVVDYTTIDLQNINSDLEKPYIYITGYNQNNIPNSVAYQYKNVNDEYICKYKFGGGDWQTEPCDSDKINIRYAEYNTSLTIMISKPFADKDGVIYAEEIYKKTINLNFIESYPSISFETYYNNLTKVQVLKIMLKDFEASDVFLYSVDLVNWNRIITKEENILNFTENQIVYFRILRNNQVITDSIYSVVLGKYSISISEDKTLDEINDLIGFVYDKSFFSQITSFFDNLKINIGYFNQIFDVFFSKLPIIVQNLFVLMFILLLIFLFLKMGGWNS